MLSEKYILQQFNRRTPGEQVELLMQALDFMKADGRRAKADCIALAMDIPLFPKVARIEKMDGYTLELTFENGESRKIDFENFFQRERRLERLLLENPEIFKTVEINDGALSWPEIGIHSKDENGQDVFLPYDIDPALLYEHATPIRSTSRAENTPPQ